MADERRLLCVLAHPDDESLGVGGTLARYAAAGVSTYVLCATRGERGWPGDEREYPGPAALGQLREAELRAAAAVLGVRGLEFLDYIDGEVDRADPSEVIARIVAQVRLVRPTVVLTFSPDGATGHPDHIAIGQFTAAALLCAADAGYGAGTPHRAAKLYYMVEGEEKIAAYRAIFGDTAMCVDGVKRAWPGWPAWAITTRIDARAHWRQVWRAVNCHQTQLPVSAAFAQVSPEVHQVLWGRQEYYRALSLVNGGRAVEHDLFDGLP